MTITASRVLQEERANLGTTLAEVRRSLLALRAALMDAEAELRPLGEQADPAQVAKAMHAAQGVLEPALRANADATEALCSIQVLSALKRAGEEA